MVMVPSNPNSSGVSGVSTTIHLTQTLPQQHQQHQQPVPAQSHDHINLVREQRSNEPCVPIAWRFYKRNNSNVRKQNRYISHKDAQLGLSLVVFFVKSLPPHIFQYCFPGLTLDQSCVKGTVLIQDGRFLDELLFRVVGVDGEQAHVDNAQHIDQLDRFDIEPVLQFFYSFGLVKLPSYSDNHVRSLSEKLDQIALTTYGSTTSAFYTKRNDGATATAINVSASKNGNHPQFVDPARWAHTMETTTSTRPLSTSTIVEEEVVWMPPAQPPYNHHHHQLAPQPLQYMSPLPDQSGATTTSTLSSSSSSSSSKSVVAQPIKPTQDQHYADPRLFDRANIDADTDSSSSCEYEQENEREPYQRLYLTKPESTTFRKKPMTARKSSLAPSSNTGRRKSRVRSVLKDFPTF